MPDAEDMRMELSKYRYKTALETYENAKMSFENGFFRDTINRSYYTVFYAIKAILVLGTIDFKRHKDVIAYFNKEYVASEIFPRKLGRKLGRLKQIREENDYDDFVISSKEDAKAQLETAEEFLVLIKEYLTKEYMKLRE